MTTRNQHGQPHIEYRHAQNHEKALIGLLGLLDGITADQQLKPSEVACLQVWLADHDDLLSRSTDGDLNDLRWQLHDILKDGVVSADEIEDTQDLVQAIIEERMDGYQYNIEKAVQHLMAMLQGMMADGIVNEREARHLKAWLRRTHHIHESWPADILVRRMREILSDGIVTADELTHLKDMLEKITGGGFQEHGTITGIVTRAWELEIEAPASVEFSGQVFVMTGAFLFGTRKHCQAEVTLRGGEVAENITKKTRYVVVGSEASRDWINSSHGRKLERAMELRRGGQVIDIITESDWAQALDRVAPISD